MEHATLVWRPRRTQDSCNPFKQVITLRPGTAVRRRVQSDLGVLLQDPLGRGAQGL